MPPYVRYGSRTPRFDRRASDDATELLRRHNPAEAAEIMQALSFERQRTLFRHLPPDFAAILAGQFPYFHAYALLYSLPTEHVAAIVGAMVPAELQLFLDALPEEAWQMVTRALDDVHLEGASRVAESHGGKPELQEQPAHVELPPIVEARQIEKYYRQPEGREIQVIAPMDLSIEPNTIVALLGPSGSGNSRMDRCRRIR